MIYQAGLVLEGGGMKGVYTCGVLDFFLEKDIAFEKNYGVSAGACHLCSFLSKQKGRAFAVNVDYLDGRDYCSLHSLLTTGDLFNVDTLYRRIPEELYPFDYDAFNANPCKGYAVVTNIETGLPEYLPLRDMKKDIQAVRASASLPLVSRNVEIGGKVYLDGGISDGIPVIHSVTDGNRKNVVIMTKEAGYRRQPTSALNVFKLRYRKYPQVYEVMKRRHIVYNQTLDYIEEQQKAGNVFLLQPQTKSAVGRVEKDRTKLEALYREGYEDAAAQYDALMAFLQA